MRLRHSAQRWSGGARNRNQVNREIRQIREMIFGMVVRVFRWGSREGARPSGRFNVRLFEAWKNSEACFKADGEAA